MQASKQHQKTKPAADLLTVRQVAAHLNVHPNTVRRWARQGRLSAHRLGSRRDRRFHRSDVEALLRVDSHGNRPIGLPSHPLLATDKPPLSPAELSFDNTA